MASDLDEQVTSVRLSQALQGAGVPQQSVWLWVPLHVDGTMILARRERDSIGPAAFTIHELLSVLGDRFGVLERFEDGTWGCYVPHDCGINGMDRTPEDALAQLVLAVYGGDPDGA